MWNILEKNIFKACRFLTAETNLQQQIRTTFILQRRNPPPLSKKGWKAKPLKSKHYIYDMVKDSNTDKLPSVSVILTTYVENIGKAGDKLELKRDFAYNNLLLPGVAVYASSENLEKYKDYINKDSDITYSSQTALLTVKTLSRIVLSIVLNKENPWTLQAWHVKASFRKCGYVVPEDAITLPERPIQGPDMKLEGKEFFVTVTINNREKAKVRCRIHHWSTDSSDRLPHEHEFWKHESEPIFEEQAEVLAKLPKKGEDVNVRELLQI